MGWVTGRLLLSEAWEGQRRSCGIHRVDMSWITTSCRVCCCRLRLLPTQIKARHLSSRCVHWIDQRMSLLLDWSHSNWLMKGRLLNCWLNSLGRWGWLDWLGYLRLGWLYRFGRLAIKAEEIESV